MQQQSRRIARDNGVRYAYTGNIPDPESSSTYCHQCGALLIGRTGYNLTAWNLTAEGNCSGCGTRCAGVFQTRPGQWGSRRMPVRLADFAESE